MSESNIELRIQNLERKLQITVDNVEKAEIAEKIKNLKNELRRINIKEGTPEPMTHIDAPVIADRDNTENLKLERGQIMNSGSLFSMGI